MDVYVKQLAAWSKVMITVEELSILFHKKGQGYEELANYILKLESEEILQPVKSTGRTTRTPTIAHRYRIDKSKLKADFHGELHRYNKQFYKEIRLDHYYSLPSEVFYKDLPFIERIHTYLTSFGFPKEPVPAPERSVEVVGDEKWIDEGGGLALLEKIALLDGMKIMPVSDPLMMAFNAKPIANTMQYHLIVENKTTYQALLSVLEKTEFSTLIYGSGNKIIKSIEQFDWQYPGKHAEHIFYYFGDIDRSGLTIWHLLNEKRRAILALPFYEACLEKRPFEGKTNQRMDIEAVHAFIVEMPGASKLESLLKEGFYYPQEVLKTAELGMIWREWSWNFTIGKG